MTKYAERIAIVETKVETIDKRTASIEEKLDILVTAHNRQRGFIAATAVIFTTLGGLAAAVWQWLADKVHVG